MALDRRLFPREKYRVSVRPRVRERHETCNPVSTGRGQAEGGERVMPEAITGHKRRFCLRSTLRKADPRSVIHDSEEKY